VIRGTVGGEESLLVQIPRSVRRLQPWVILRDRAPRGSGAGSGIGGATSLFVHHILTL